MRQLPHLCHTWPHKGILCLSELVGSFPACLPPDLGQLQATVLEEGALLIFSACP